MIIDDGMKDKCNVVSWNIEEKLDVLNKKMVLVIGR